MEPLFGLILSVNIATEISELVFKHLFLHHNKLCLRLFIFCICQHVFLTFNFLSEPKYQILPGRLPNFYLFTFLKCRRFWWTASIFVFGCWLMNNAFTIKPVRTEKTPTKTPTGEFLGPLPVATHSILAKLCSYYYAHCWLPLLPFTLFYLRTSSLALNLAT